MFDNAQFLIAYWCIQNSTHKKVGINDELVQKKTGKWNILAKEDKADIYLDNHFLILWAYVSCKKSTAWFKDIVMLKNQIQSIMIYIIVFWGWVHGLFAICFYFICSSIKFLLFLCKTLSILGVQGSISRNKYLSAFIYWSIHFDTN